MTDFGYAGQILRVDLSNRRIFTSATADYSRRFWGGRGLAAKIYWDEVKPEIGAFDPENNLIIVTGPVAGFTRFAGCRWQICGKSPQRDPPIFSYANLGGSWGAWLKFAGYDGLVVSGKSENPVYLYIDDQGTVEIKDASYLWGKSAFETEIILHNELGKEARIMGIGQAAENLVSYSTLFAAEYASGSSGLGSVMGSKKLKAVVVKAENKQRPQAAYPDRLQSLAQRVFELHEKNKEDMHQTHTGRPVVCYGCVAGCPRKTYEAENGQQFKSFCQSSIYYLEAAVKYHQDALEVYRLAERLCDCYGLDTVVMESLVRWLGKCYQAGILSDANTGLPLSRLGSAEFIENLIHKISYREGIGDILARGTLQAAKSIGSGSEALIGSGGIATKASETRDYDPRMILPNALIYATEPRRSIQNLHAISTALRRWTNWRKGLSDAFVSTEVFRDFARKYWGSVEAADFSTYQGKALAAQKIQDYGYANECMILCDFTWPIRQIHDLDDNLRQGTLESQILSAITGCEIDEKEFLRIGEKTFNLQRMILNREGWGGRQGDTLLGYLHEEPLQDVYWSAECLAPGQNDDIVSRKGAVVDRVEFEKMKTEYYQFRGWDVETGIPTRAKLEELGLGDIALS